MANAICFLSADRRKGQIAIHTIRAQLIAFVSLDAATDTQFGSYNACYVNPFVQGLPPPPLIAIFVNRVSVAAGYEIRRKTSSGGQRF